MPLTPTSPKTLDFGVHVEESLSKKLPMGDTLGFCLPNCFVCVSDIRPLCVRAWQHWREFKTK